MRYVMCFLPLIGAVIGFLSWIWGTYAGLFVHSHNFYTVILVLIPVLVSGGIHLDGLLDTSDALNSYQPREKKKLEILKDSMQRSICNYCKESAISFYILVFTVK